MRLIPAVMLLAIAPAYAAPMTIRVVRRAAPISEQHAGIVLHVRSVCEAADCSGPPIVQEIAVGGGDVATVDVEPGRSAEIATVAPGYWAPSMTAHAGDAVTLPLWPASTLEGYFEVDRGESLPATASIHLRSSPAVAERDSIAETIEPCAVQGRRWSCSVPAASLDLRLSAPGFVPAYFWDVGLAAGTTKAAGTVHLVRGASLSGSVSLKSGDYRGVIVELRAPASTAAAPGRSVLATARPNARGFFQFAGIALGSYEVVALMRAASEGHAGGIAITEPRELVIEQPIRITALADLQVFLTPPLAPNGAPWSVRLERNLPDSHLLILAAVSSASASGVWKQPQLQEGRYRLSVSDGSGSILGRRVIELTAASPPVMMNLDLVPVTGDVALGDRPLPATVTLSWRDGSSVKFRADERGRFQGMLPHEGQWHVRISPTGVNTSIDRPTIEVRRSDDGVAPIHLALPSGKIKGMLVDEQDRPVSGWALVSRGGVIEGDSTSDESGSFEIDGIEPGPVQVAGHSADGAESGLLPYTAAGDDAVSLRVVLHPPSKATGSVRSGGQPVAGAIIRCFADTFTEKRETYSGPDGEFELALPPHTSAVDLIVLAPGFPARWISAVPAASPIDVQLGGAAAKLRLLATAVPPWPMVWRGGRFVGALFLGYPPNSPFYRGLEYDVEPGTYTICPAAELSAKCIAKQIDAGTAAVVDVRPLWPDLKPRKEMLPPPPAKGGSR
jgi:hypothetical protein